MTKTELLQKIDTNLTRELMSIISICKKDFDESDIYLQGASDTIKILTDIHKKHPDFSFEEIIDWFWTDDFYC